MAKRQRMERNGAAGTRSSLRGGNQTRKRSCGEMEKMEREERRETSFAVENSFNTSTDDILTFPRRTTFPGVVGVL